MKNKTQIWSNHHLSIGKKINCLNEKFGEYRLNNYLGQTKPSYKPRMTNGTRHS